MSDIPSLGLGLISLAGLCFGHLPSMSFENGMKDILKLKDHNQQSLHREKIAMEKSQDEKAETKNRGRVMHGDASHDHPLAVRHTNTRCNTYVT